MTARKRLGYLLGAAGAAVLVTVASVYVQGVIARDRARAAWAAIEAHSAVAAAEASLTTPGPHAAVRGSPVARLVIPSIGFDEVVVEGIGSEELNAGPGHFPGSALPGDRGNAVISAHRDRHFHHLDAVAVGDTITTQTPQHDARWVVTGRRIVPRDARALFATAEPTLTLTTCWPVRYFGPAPDRLILTAKPIDRATVAVRAPARPS